MSLEEALDRNTAALARLADLIERNRGYLESRELLGPVEQHYFATCEGSEVLDNMPVVARMGDRRQDAVTEAKLGAAVEKAVEHAIEHAAPALAEAIAEAVENKEEQAPKIMIGGDGMTFAPGEDIPEFTWEGVAKQFRKYAQKHGRDEAVKLAAEFGLKIPLNKDELTPDRYEDFYYACQN